MSPSPVPGVAKVAQIPVLRRQAAHRDAAAEGRRAGELVVKDEVGSIEALAALGGLKPDMARKIRWAISEAASRAASHALDAVEDGAERIGFVCDLCLRIQPSRGKCGACLGHADRLVVAWTPMR